MHVMLQLIIDMILTLNAPSTTLCLKKHLRHFRQ